MLSCQSDITDHGVRKPLPAQHCPRGTHMCLVLFQGCQGHATKEKMRVGAKERPQGMLTGQLVRPTESSKLEELKIPPNVPQQQSWLGFRGHGPSHVKERPQLQRQSPTLPTGGITGTGPTPSMRLSPGPLRTCPLQGAVASFVRLLRVQHGWQEGGGGGRGAQVTS